MNDSDSPIPQGALPPADPLAALLRATGARPEVAMQRQQRVEYAVRAQWQRQLRAQRRRRWIGVGSALAASLAGLAVWLGVLMTPAAPGPASSAVLVHVEGELRQRIDGGWQRLQVGDRLRLGAELELAADGLASFSTERLASLRLRGGSRLRLIDEQHIELDQGELYLDSGTLPGGVQVRTAQLSAVDIGTRFAVGQHQGRSTVAVRDGRVRLDGAVDTELDAGERLRLQADGAVERDRLPAHANDWLWARAAAVPFAADGRPLRDLLVWYAYESGLQLQIAADAALQRRLEAPLHGELGDLQGEDLLDIARAAGALRIDSDPTTGTLHVSEE